MICIRKNILNLFYFLVMLYDYIGLCDNSFGLFIFNHSMTNSFNLSYYSNYLLESFSSINDLYNKLRKFFKSFNNSLIFFINLLFALISLFVIGGISS